MHDVPFPIYSKVSFFESFFNHKECPKINHMECHNLVQVDEKSFMMKMGNRKSWKNYHFYTNI